jgi:hypothetical protein
MFKKACRTFNKRGFNSCLLALFRINSITHLFLNSLLLYCHSLIMKTLILHFLILLSFNAFSQKLYSTKYFKFNNQEVTGLDSAGFIQYIYEPMPNSDLVKVEEKYKNGRLKFKGLATEKYLPIIYYEGKTTSYFENGAIKSEETFFNGILKGEAKYYLNTGKLSKEGSYIASKGSSCFKATKIYDSNGINILDSEGNGSIEVNNPKSSFNEKFKNGYKDGLWTAKNKYFTVEYLYKDGKFISGTTTDSLGSKISYNELFSYPYFNGNKSMRSFGENRWRPSSVNLIGNNDLEGIVIYSFDIDRKGQTNNYKLIESLSNYSDKKALNYLKKIKWQPATNRGIPVDTSGFMYIINFKLEN